MRAVKNWDDYVSLYFGKIKSEHVILKMRNGIKIKLRTDSTDLMAFTHVWLLKEYERPGFEIKNNDTIIDIGGILDCLHFIHHSFANLARSIALSQSKRILIC